MIKGKWSFLIWLLLLGLTALACNFSGAISGSAPPISATLTPLAPSEFALVESLLDSEYFQEEFDLGLPEGWNSSPGWSAGSGILSTSNAGAEIEIPGDWQDKALFTRLRFYSEGFTLKFNQSEVGAYGITWGQDSLSLAWHPVDGDPESLEVVQIEIDQGWHDLVLRQTQGRMEVIFDSQSLIKGVNPGFSPSGSLKLVNVGAGLLEIERFVAAPPGLGTE